MRTLRSRHFRLLCSALLVVGISGCAQNLPPELKPAAAAVEINLRIQELQKTVIAAYDAQPRAISAERAFLINRFCMSAAKVTTEVPAGWQKTMKASWTELKGNLKTPPTDGQLGIIWGIVDRLIGAL